MKYFGTDGIRGIYNGFITEELCYKAGCALSEYFACDCVFGMDSRESSPALAEAVIRGITERGMNVYNAGIIPSPAISHLSTFVKHPLGIMITASHNPPEYNGIKVFFNGGKLTEEEETGIEYCIIQSDGLQIKPHFKGKKLILDAKEVYITHLLKGAKRLDGIKVSLDLGFGAASLVAREVFYRLGASVKCENAEPVGSRINVDCGALYPERLCRTMGADYDFGFAFDGDADRVAFVHKGSVMDGDSVLYNLSKRELSGDTVVGTVMSNSVLERELKADGKRFIMTDVGDKNVYAVMKKYGYNLGGEQSGHYIFYPKAHSGDGLLSALNILEQATKGELKRLKLDPQKTVSLYAGQSMLDDPRIKKLKEKHSARLTRLTVRMSGTEPKIRITAQALSENLVDDAIYDFTNLLSHADGI